MSNYWDESVYADVDDEARHDYYRESPPPDYPSPSELAPCERCGNHICDPEECF